MTTANFTASTKKVHMNMPDIFWHKGAESEHNASRDYKFETTPYLNPAT
jgi:hypothetical protein